MEGFSLKILIWMSAMNVKIKITDAVIIFPLLNGKIDIIKNNRMPISHTAEKGMSSTGLLFQ
jgi:hypothetical protein